MQTLHSLSCDPQVVKDRLTRRTIFLLKRSIPGYYNISYRTKTPDKKPVIQRPWIMNETQLTHVNLTLAGVM